MIPPVSVRRRRVRRSLPPGQKLLLFIFLASVCCSVTVWFFQPRPNVAQQLAAAPVSSQTAQTLPTQVPSVNSQNLSAPARPSVASQLANLPPASQLPFPLREELSSLEQSISEAANKPNLHAGVFVVEPDTGRYADIDSHRAYSAASMIKLPVLVKLLQALDSGQVKMDQQMVIRPDLKGGGSGCLQWRPDNAKLSLNECAQLMMIISDNTATNMIIDLLGGKDKCNEDFAKWGLVQTKINNWLPDLPGTNTTSPYDLALLMAKVDSGQLISANSRSWLFTTLEKNKIRTLLPMGIPAGTKIADKTGDIATLVGDVGIITTKDGKRYIASVSVERPWNDRRANEMIRQISKQVYAGITGDTEGIKTLQAQQQAARAAAPRSTRRGRHRRHRH